MIGTILIGIGLAGTVACGAFGEGSETVKTLKLGAANAYVVQGERGDLLIDAGMDADGKKLAAALAAAGEKPEDIAVIVVTHAHPDHVGGLAAMKALTGAKVVCTAEAAGCLRRGASSPIVPRTLMGRFIDAISPEWKLAPVEPDLTFVDEMDLTPLGFAGKAVRMPGHSADSLCLFLDTGEAFVGDLVRGSGRDLSFGMFYEDEAACAESLRRVIAASPRTVHLSHGTATDCPSMEAFLRSAGAR